MSGFANDIGARQTSPPQRTSKDRERSGQTCGAAAKGPLNLRYFSRLIDFCDLDRRQLRQRRPTGRALVQVESGYALAVGEGSAGLRRLFPRQSPFINFLSRPQGTRGCAPGRASGANLCDG